MTFIVVGSILVLKEVTLCVFCINSKNWAGLLAGLFFCGIIHMTSWKAEKTFRE